MAAVDPGVPQGRPRKPLPSGDPHELQIALERLDERERQVLELRYGLDGERPQLFPHIGRVLGVSAERARQLEAKALRKLGPPSSEPPKPRAAPLQVPGRHRNGLLRPWALVLLRLEPVHGYRLNERLRAAGFPELDYRFLRGLEDEGLVRSTWAPGDGVGPERRIYRLTSKGTKQLRRDAEALSEMADGLRVFFEHYDEVLSDLDRARAKRRGNGDRR